MAPEDIQRLVESALEEDNNRNGSSFLSRLSGGRSSRGATKVNVEVSLLASGGYNDVWLAQIGTASTEPKATVVSILIDSVLAVICWLTACFAKAKDLDASILQSQSKAIVRVPNEDSLKPHQIRNEVSWLKYISSHHRDIPVPKVFAFSDGEDGTTSPYIIEEYINGRSLSDIWPEYSENDKEAAAKQVAEVVVRLGEIRFNRIGGMTPGGELGPTVEGHKLFKGRDKFHSPEYYDIGPYRTVEDYIKAMYDKEIYFYTHASDDCFDEDDFEHMSRNDFIQNLKTKQKSVLARVAEHPSEESFVLCHNDLQGRNILMQGTKIVGIIDWEFAGSFPLSELVDGGVEVLEMEDEADEEECFKWCARVVKLVESSAKDRGWTDADVQLLDGGGNADLQAARVEMFPSPPEN